MNGFFARKYVIISYMTAIDIPEWANIVDYRTMTDEKKRLAVAGDKRYQYEWMKEEVNEFYEAIALNDIAEIRDEAMGLIRASQQFRDSKRVKALWDKVRPDVKRVFPSERTFLETFKKWKIKKTKKGQAHGVEAYHLMQYGGQQLGNIDINELLHFAKLKWLK